MSVRRAQAEISAAEFAEWMAYDRLDPIGESRGDWRAAMLATVFASAYRRKGSRPYKIEDFMPVFRKPKQRRMTADQLRDAVLSINKSAGGKVRKHGDNR